MRMDGEGGVTDMALGECTSVWDGRCCVSVCCFDLCPRLDAIQMQKCSVQHGRGRDGKRRGEEREMKMDKGERISKCKRERGGGRVETHPESVI